VVGATWPGSCFLVLRGLDAPDLSVYTLWLLYVPIIINRLLCAAQSISIFSHFYTASSADSPCNISAIPAATQVLPYHNFRRHYAAN